MQSWAMDLDFCGVEIRWATHWMSKTSDEEETNSCTC